MSAERRKVERRIRRTERALRGLSDAGPEAQPQQAELNRQLAQLKEDLEYVRVRGNFFQVDTIGGQITFNVSFRSCNRRPAYFNVSFRSCQRIVPFGK